MWDYVFSTRHMTFDAAAGVVFFLLFRVLLGQRQPSFLGRLVFCALALAASHWYLGGPRGRAMPSGQIGTMAAMCAQEHSQDACLCAIDTIEERVGHPKLTQLAVRAEANGALPPDMVTALADCRD